MPEPEPEEEKKEDQKDGEGDNNEIDEPLSPRSLKKRIDEIIDSISHTAFHFTRRGLLEKHKIIVSSMLTFRILLSD